MATGVARDRIAQSSAVHNEVEKIRRDLPKIPIYALQELVWGHNIRIQFAGPDGTPFAATRFELDVEISDGYPFQAPIVRLVDAYRIFHPNVCPKSGAICLDILNDANAWSPSIGLEKLVMSIMSLLAVPCTDHGLNHEAVNLLRKDPLAYETRVAKALQASCGMRVPYATSDSSEDSIDGEDEELPSTAWDDVFAHAQLFAKYRMTPHKWQDGDVDTQHKSEVSAVNSIVRERSSFENAVSSGGDLFGIDDNAFVAIHRPILTPRQPFGRSPGRARPRQAAFGSTPRLARSGSPERNLGWRSAEEAAINAHNSSGSSSSDAQVAKTFPSCKISL